MKFTTALVASILTASALAAPGTAARKARHNKRTAAARSSRPMIPANVTSAINGPENINTEYSTNWAGAALVGSGYTGVTGTFKIPTSFTPPSGDSSSGSYYASAWVGLDGYTCETAILQTGVDFNLVDGKVSFDAWYEWYPDYAYDFSGISFSEGDTVKLTIKATSKTAGTATVENVTKGTTVSHSFSSESDALCETNAEWIVEDFEESTSSGGEEQVPFVDFGTVTFTSAYATTSSGTVGVSGAQIVEMTDSTGKNVIVDASVSGSETVIVTYV